MKMRRCEDEKMLRRRCEDEKMFYRPPLLEEPCAQTLSGKNVSNLQVYMKNHEEHAINKKLRDRSNESWNCTNQHGWVNPVRMWKLTPPKKRRNSTTQNGDSCSNGEKLISADTLRMATSITLRFTRKF